MISGFLLIQVLYIFFFYKTFIEITNLITKLILSKEKHEDAVCGASSNGKNIFKNKSLKAMCNFEKPLKKSTHLL